MKVEIKQHSLRVSGALSVHHHEGIRRITHDYDITFRPKLWLENDTMLVAFHNGDDMQTIIVEGGGHDKNSSRY